MTGGIERVKRQSMGNVISIPDYKNVDSQIIDKEP